VLTGRERGGVSLGATGDGIAQTVERVHAWESSMVGRVNMANAKPGRLGWCYTTPPDRLSDPRTTGHRP
jgi:hypothetical protein